jgi:hypothetical protein
MLLEAKNVVTYGVGSSGGGSVAEAARLDAPQASQTGNLEPLAAIWARQTGRAIAVAPGKT